jgi:hypothetical protein
MWACGFSSDVFTVDEGGRNKAGRPLKRGHGRGERIGGRHDRRQMLIPIRP